ncbi:hypothetical protein JNUCC64_15525 [Streptomyces sp. JNUCC 64]
MIDDTLSAPRSGAAPHPATAPGSVGGSRPATASAGTSRLVTASGSVSTSRPAAVPRSPVRPPRTPSAWTVALAPAVLMAALGLWGIRREGTLWGDEAVTYAMAQRDPSEIVRTLLSVDVVHGLYYLLTHGVFTVTGPGLVPLRLPSLLGMCATAAGVALIGRRLAGPRAGLLAGLLLPLLPDAQRYAQEGRSYALVCALVTFGTLLLCARRWPAYAVVMLTACLLHEFAVLALLAHGVTLAPRPPRGWWAAALAVVAGLTPLALFSATQSGQVDWITPPGTGDLVLLVVLAVLGWCAGTTTGGRRVRAVALPLLLLPMGLLIAVSFLHPLYVDRYVLPQVIGVALLTGAVLDRHWSTLTAGTAAVAAVASLIVLGPPLRSPESRKSDVGAVTELIQRMSRPGDGVLFLPGPHRGWTLAHPGALTGLTDLSLGRSPRASHTLFGVEAPPGEVRDRLLRHRGRVVVVRGPADEPLDPGAVETAKRTVLAAHFVRCAERTANQARVAIHVRDRADC